LTVGRRRREEAAKAAIKVEDELLDAEEDEKEFHVMSDTIIPCGVQRRSIGG
jgi:hypothetical protein